MALFIAPHRHGRTPVSAFITSRRLLNPNFNSLAMWFQSFVTLHVKTAYGIIVFFLLNRRSFLADHFMDNYVETEKP